MKQVICFSLILSIIFLGFGCGTLVSNNKHFQNKFKKLQCVDGCIQKLPRIYSGVVYDFDQFKYKCSTSEIGHAIILDIPFSLIFDTVYLPITAYFQFTEGSLTCLESNNRTIAIKQLKEEPKIVSANNTNDIKIHINLDKKIVTENKSIKYDTTSIFEGLGRFDTKDLDVEEGAVALLIVLPILLSVDTATTPFRNTDIYLYPLGYKEDYLQKINWGDNIINIPAELKNTIFDIVIKMEGFYNGTFKGRVRLSDGYIKLD